MRLQGPTVDVPHGSLFGVVVLVAGRGLQALLTVVPMLLALACGRGVPGRFGRVVVALAGATVLLFTTAAAIPARTAAVPGPDGIAELTHVGRLGVMIRGAHATAPVLLFVPGAPGGSERGAVRHRLGAVEQRFVMATLDRRGGGSSYPALDPTGRVTLDREVDDILAVTDWLRQRFGFLMWENQAYDQHDNPLDVGVRELTLLQKAHTLNAMLDTWDVLYPRMQRADLRRDAPALAVPVWFVQGENEMRGLAVLFDEWYAQLTAPHKQLVTVPGAGHRVMFEQPDAIVKVLDGVLAG